MYLVRQNFNNSFIADVEGQVKLELDKIGVGSRVFSGMKVCLPFGSRGFPYGFKIIKTLSDVFKSWGADPFVIPAMGSHGGGTDDGQLQVLKKMGITEESLGIPIKSCADSVLIGTTASGVHVYCDRYALEADGVFLFNRVKPHTAFRAEVESGLTKMMTVGLGKVKGAEATHRAGLGQHIVEMADVIAGTINLLGGIAVVDNARGDAYILQGVKPENRVAVDKELLQIAWKQLPGLPFNHLHVLVVDRIGKNISGTGMDINVIGMNRRFSGSSDIKYETIVVLDLTPESKGNAHGIGYADITTKVLVGKIDYQSTYKNALTTGFLCAARIPCTMESSDDAIRTACNLHGVDGCRVVRVKDTKNLEYIWVSGQLLREMQDVEIIKRVDSIFETGHY